MSKYIKVVFFALILILLFSDKVFAADCGGTYSYTGAQQTCTVPTGKTKLDVHAYGAGGGSSGGAGGHARGIITVTPGETLYIYVGGLPSSATGGYNGGGDGGCFSHKGVGGGGGTDLRRGGTALANRVIIAGGGAGAGSSGAAGGDGGASTGEYGSPGGTGLYPGSGGGGGTQSAGGSVGGSLGNGGDGQCSTEDYSYGGGGGGGGYYGGGAGGYGWYSAGGGGGGGSNYVSGSSTVSERGINSSASNGYLTITATISCSSTACGTTSDGSTCTSYSSSAPSCGTTCSSVSRTSTCTNGSWDSEPYTYGTCQATCCASGGCPQTNTGSSCTAYEPATSPACGTPCTSQVSSCQSNATWNNTPYSYSSCTSCCSLPWGGSITNGQSVTAYSVQTAVAPNECVDSSITRTCNNGTLSGDSSYQYGSCTDQNECVFPDTIPTGGVKTITTSCSIGAFSDYITGVEDTNTSATDASNSAALIIDGSTLTIGSANNQTVLFGKTVLKSTRLGNKVDYAGANASRDITTGDFNKDGYPDFAVAVYGGTAMSVFLNNGNGTFAAKADYTALASPIGIANGDLNGDTYPDIVTTGSTGDQVSVFINDGDGTFATKVDYAVGDLPYGVVLADFNADQILDIATANYNADTVSVLLNDGDGTFDTTTGDGAYGVGDQPMFLAAGDVSGDGKPDIITPNYGTANTISVLINTGSGFNTKVDYTTGVDSRDVVVANLNTDTNLDLAVANDGGDTISVLLNDGDGTFDTTTGDGTYTTGDQPYQLTTADISGNGNQDLIVTNYNVDTVSVLLNNGDGTFQNKVDYTGSNGATGIATADVNLDGKPDIGTANALTSYVMSVYVHKPKASIVIAQGVGSKLMKGVRWVQDTDEDNYPDALAATIAASLRPTGYYRRNYMINTGNIAKQDCAPSDAQKWQNQQGFTDSDSDGYASSSYKTVTKINSTGAAPTYTSTSISLTLPTNTQADDVMVAAITSGPAITTVPTGWTLISTLGSSQYMSVYYKVATSSDVGPFIWRTSSSGYLTGILKSYRNVNTSYPINTVYSEYSNDASDSLTTISSMTIASRAAMLAGFYNGFGEIGCSNPTGMADCGCSAYNNYNRTCMADGLQTDSGATGDKTMSFGASATYRRGLLVALNPALDTSSVCSGNNLPSGYTGSPAAADDCDDTNINKWAANTTIYKDSDGDGYGNNATIASRSATSAIINNDTNAALTIVKPAGVVEGDLLVAAITTSTTSDTVTPDQTWTLQETQTNNETYDLTFNVYTRVATSSEPSTYSFSTSAAYKAGIIASYSNIDTTTPINVKSSNTSLSGTTIWTTNDITTTQPNTMLVGIFAGAYSSARTWTPPSGMSEVGDRSSTQTNLMMANVTQTAMGAVGTKTATSTTNANGATAILALNPRTKTGCYGNSASYDTGYLGTSFDCDDSTSNIYQSLSTATDTDQDGFVSDSISTNCVGASTTVSGRTYYKNSSGNYTYVAAAAALGYDCNDADGNVYPGAGCTITRRAVATTFDASGLGATSMTINKPTGTVEYDTIITAISFSNNATITAPSGWNLIRRVDNAQTTPESVAVYYKIAGSSEPASYVWDFNGTTVFFAAWSASYYNTTSLSPIDVNNGQTNGTSASKTTSYAAPGATTTANNEMVITAHGAYGGTYTFTAPSGMTEFADLNNTGSRSIEGAQVAQASAGATGNKTATCSVSSYGASVLFTLK